MRVECFSIIVVVIVVVSSSSKAHSTMGSNSSELKSRNWLISWLSFSHSTMIGWFLRLLFNPLLIAHCRMGLIVVVVTIVVVVVVGDGTRPYQFSWMFVSIQKEENHSPFLFQAYLK